MSEKDILKLFKTFNDEKNQEILNNVKHFYVFTQNRDREMKNAIIVTNDDKTYAVGYNSKGVLGFGHENEIKELTLNKELCNKTIVEFANSEYYTIGKTLDGKLYIWGKDWLNIAYVADNELKCYRPVLKEDMLQKKVIEVSCSYSYSLFLTSDGEVYGWGFNEWIPPNQFLAHIDFQPVAYVVSEFDGEKVKSISVGFKHSLALTHSGRVFSWGLNSWGQLGRNVLSDVDDDARPVELKKDIIIDKIACGMAISLLLTNDGDIYAFGRNVHKQYYSTQIVFITLNSDEDKLKYPIKLERAQKFTDIASHYTEDFCCALASNGFYYIWGNIGHMRLKQPREKQVASFNELFNHYLGITFKTVVINEENSFTYDGRYNHEFEELMQIGKGTFGEVYKVLHSLDDQHYAIKKIKFEGICDEIKAKYIQELKVLARLQNNDYIVQYKNSWIEYNKNLYIQMELCFTTLREILVQTRNLFSRKQFQIMSLIEYYISSEIFREILESIDFLHKLKPKSIIHRDLKPTNILITNAINGRFVKLADFGLAVVHEFDAKTHTQCMGTFKYCAPEVLSGRFYDTKVDIYSLGVITQELFDIDIYASSTMNDINNSNLKTKYLFIMKIINEMMSAMKIKRPDCDEILSQSSQWCLSYNKLKSDPDFDSFMKKSMSDCSIDECFSYYFLKVKLTK